MEDQNQVQSANVIETMASMKAEQVANGEQPKAAAKPKKASAKPKKDAPVKKAAVPSVEKYGWKSTHTGPSTEVNKNHSRTKVDPAVFNSNPKANVTARDQAAINALRKQFGNKAFERRNIDAGILRRLMERGLAKHVAGDPNTLTGTFALTKAGLGQQAVKAA
jgi:hypothetical protein